MVLAIRVTNIQKQVSEILSFERRGGLKRAMLDVLRVLVVNKGVSWRSELIQDLALLYSFRDEPKIADEGELDLVLGELEMEGLVKVETRAKGALDAPRSIKDKLISLVDLRATYNALSGDGVLTSYMHWLMAQAGK